MTYKGKKVSRHRYRQLTISQRNHRKYMDALLHAFYPSAIRREMEK